MQCALPAPLNKHGALGAPLYEDLLYRGDPLIRLKKPFALHRYSVLLLVTKIAVCHQSK